MKRKFALLTLVCLLFGACAVLPGPSGPVGIESTVETGKPAINSQPATTPEETAPPATAAPAIETAPLWADGTESGAFVAYFHEVTAQTGKTTTPQGIWGGNQNRIVTVDGTAYFAYLTAGPYGEGKKDFSLYALPEGAETWQLLGSGVCTGDAAIVLADAFGRIYVATAGDHNPYGPKKTYAVWEYRPETGEFVEHLFDKSAGITNYNYFAACIDPQSGVITMLFCGGDDPGAFAYNTFDTAAKTFGKVRSIALDYRHCYVYIQPDGTGGLSLQAGRDVLGSVLGYPPMADGKFPYAFDGVRYWHIDDPVAGVVTTDVTIRAEIPADYASAGFYPTVMNNYTGDCFVDHLGRTHIFYSVHALDTAGSTVTFQCRIENGAIVFHEKLWDGVSSLRMVQDGDNNFWLLQMPYGGHGLTLYQCNENGQNPQKKGQFTLPAEANISYAGLSVAVSRGGTKAGNFVDAVYPSQENKWFYFRLFLE